MNRILPVLLLTFCTQSSLAQKYLRAHDSLSSDVLGEKRMLSIMVPKEVKEGELLDVLYVTDAEMFDQYVAYVLEFQHENNLAPAQLIVGIQNLWEYPNFTRDRDLLPVPNSEYSNSGKADLFLTFIETELMPFIDKKYPNKGKTTLLGHSFGGLFTLYTLLTKPHLFDSYIASDPSCWYNGGYITTLADTILVNQDFVDKTLFIGSHSHKEMGVDAFLAVLRAKAPEGLVWKDKEYLDEHHGSVRLKDFYDGLKFTFYGIGENLEFHPMQGILLKARPFLVKPQTHSDAIRYTLDGTPPTRHSARFENSISIDSPCELTVKLFANRRPDKVVKALFKEDHVPPPLSKPTGLKNNLLNINTYDVPEGKMPEFRSIERAGFGVVNNGDFWVSQPPVDRNYAALFKGYLEIETEGYYTFYLDADDHAKFYLGGKLLLDFEKDKTQFERVSFIVPLKKGFYPIKLEYLQKEGRRWVNLRYHIPGMSSDKEPVKIPSNLLWGKNN